LSNDILKITLRYMSHASEDGGTNGAEFFLVGGHPAIDFANTLVPPPGPGIDFLRTWPDVVDWLAEAKISTDTGLDVSAARRPEALKKVLELRRDWKQVLALLVAGGKVSDEFLTRLNRSLAADRFHEVLHRAGKKRFNLVRSTSGLQGDVLVRAILARQIALFLAEANPSYLRRCANNSCVLYFYDTTKNHRRQWCSAAICGNRHRVAEFRRRQSETKESASSR
jgi:predicted RNA-binding Zn ribbon-like protein